tara:strand:- start:1617 stop:2405 length:789 start_codon:yes stop_codon:yes gene_type:complete
MDLAIMIRSHGEIPILDDTYKVPVWNVPNNIKNLHTVTLSKLGGVCYGSSDIDQFMKKVILEKKNDINIRELSTIKLIDKYLLSANMNSLSELIGISELPELTKVDAFFDKIYTKYDENSKIILFSCSNEKRGEKEQITKILKELTIKLLDTSITRFEILNRLNSFEIANLYLIDLTCDAYGIIDEYKKTNPEFVLTVGGIEYINNWARMHKIRGGNLNLTRRFPLIKSKTKNQKNKNKKNKKSKTKKQKPKNKNKKTKKII